MTFKVKDETTHERKIVGHLNRHQLKKLLVETVAREAMVDLDDVVYSAEVHFEKETEGSPAYTVGTKANIVIKIDVAATLARNDE